jgi:D-sedoheptulose 7-phosphate isomerase
MKNTTKEYIDLLFKRYPELEQSRGSVIDAFGALYQSFSTGGKLLVCGNGGSAADSDHIVGELMKGFVLPRTLDASLTEKLVGEYKDDGVMISRYLQKCLPAISLVNHPALLSAFSNDRSADFGFAQEVLGFGKNGDCLLGISTSGNSKNIVYAFETAKCLGIHTIALTGSKDSRLSSLADITIKANESETYKVQEKHLPIYHCLCLALENEFFGN